MSLGMFGPKMGTWTLSSEKDPRWNKEIREVGLCCALAEGMYPDVMTEWISECEIKFGKQPEDLTMGFWKD